MSTIYSRLGVKINKKVHKTIYDLYLENDLDFKALQAGSTSKLSFTDAKDLQTLAKNTYQTPKAPVYISFVEYIRGQGYSGMIDVRQLISTVGSLDDKTNEIMVTAPLRRNFAEMKIIQGLAGSNVLPAPTIQELSILLAIKQDRKVTYKQLIDLVRYMKEMSEEEQDVKINSMKDGMMVNHPDKPNFDEMKIIQALTGSRTLSAPKIMIISQELASQNQGKVTFKQLIDEVKRVSSLTEEKLHTILSELGRKYANHLVWLKFDKASEVEISEKILKSIENMNEEMNEEMKIGRIVKNNEIHVTVAFFGPQPNENFIRKAGLDLNTEVNLSFSKAEIFNNHLVITSEKGFESDDLKGIHNDLIKKARETGIVLNDMYNGENYRPHLTLIKDVPIGKQAELLELFNYLHSEPINLTGNIVSGYTSLYTVDDKQSHYHDINMSVD
ncbi:hypothetical protein ACN3E9_09685 [Vibrio pectenicida]|uniref:hypothetical protein n=1 Tax=Vibrio pectenicida TaxID=62763 RepID=UPI003B9CC1CF